MTPEQVEWAKKLGRCSFTPGSAHKRFARSMAAQAQANPAHPLTDKQVMYLELLVWKYRRQNGYQGDKPPFLGREVQPEGVVALASTPAAPELPGAPQLSILDEIERN